LGGNVFQCHFHSFSNFLKISHGNLTHLLAPRDQIWPRDAR
jgi:hypothetical protein